MLKSTYEEGLNEDNYEGDSNENNIENNIPADSDNSEDNDDNDDKDNDDDKYIKIDKGKRKATKEEEKAWEIENRAEDTENGSNDDTEDEEDFNKQIQIKYDEDLAKRMQSEEYKGNPDNSYNSDSSYSVISSVFNENDSKERANKKTGCTRRRKKLEKVELDKKMSNKRKHNEDEDKGESSKRNK
jgi:hypothetical protein